MFANRRTDLLLHWQLCSKSLGINHGAYALSRLTIHTINSKLIIVVIIYRTHYPRCNILCMYAFHTFSYNFVN